jgi:hypothetical protein
LRHIAVMDTKLKDMRGSARLAAWRITGLSTVLLPLFPDTAAPARGLSGARSGKTRPKRTPSLNYTPRGGLHNPFPSAFLPLRTCKLPKECSKFAHTRTHNTCTLNLYGLLIPVHITNNNTVFYCFVMMETKMPIPMGYPWVNPTGTGF